jgi:CIC family chloride channel protein
MTTRVRFTAALAVTAIGVAGFAIAFRASLALVYRSVYHTANVVEAITALPAWLRLLVPVLGGLLAGILSRLPAARSQGVSNVMEAVALGRVHLSLRATALRVMSSWGAIATGMSIGREGPLIEFGGTLGATLARFARLPLTGTRVLVAAGTAAGFAAAYNTPFAAVLFVLETIVGIAALEVLLPAMAATVIASTLTRAIAGGGPIYGARAFAIGSPLDLISFAALGVLGAAVAAVFKSALGLVEEWLAAHPVPQPWRSALGGLIVGMVALRLPDVAGNGYEPLNRLLDGELLGSALIVLLAAKIVATSASVGSGVPGGIFTPVLLCGGLAGTAVAQAVGHWSAATAVSAGSYALVAMAATTAASIHAPLTAAVLVFELSGDYAIVLPLILATVIATSVSKAFGADSVYEAELKRKGLNWTMTLEGRVRDES